MRAFIVTPGFEEALAAELSASGAEAHTRAPGIVIAPDAAAPPECVFARQMLPAAIEVRGSSVRALAEACYAALEGAVDTGQAPFTLHAFLPPPPPPTDDDTEAAPLPPELAGLGSRVQLVGRETLALLGKRRHRAFARYEQPELFAAGMMSSSRLLLQILAVDRNCLLVSAAAPQPREGGGFDLAPWPGGAAPVAIDRVPPSRAYRKLREALQWMGTAPAPGQRCMDLGASPGGWTWVALNLGAQVVAVDRAPVLPPAARHPHLEMVLGNAFTTAPPAPVDWLLCDVICEPPRSIGLIETWLAKGWCRQLVCTVKFKGRSGYGVLPPLASFLAGAGLQFWRIKHLANNKNEVTVMAIAGSGDRS